MLKLADACRGGIAVDFALAMRWENVQYFLRVCCGGIAVITRIQIAVDFRDRKYLSRGGNAKSAGIALTVLYFASSMMCPKSSFVFVSLLCHVIIVCHVYRSITKLIKAAIYVQSN